MRWVRVRNWSLGFFWGFQVGGYSVGSLKPAQKILVALWLTWLALPLVGRGTQTNLLFGISNPWRYEETANLDGTTWPQPNYDDSLWPSGPGLLAYETCGCLPELIRTTLATNDGKYTFYFRREFVFTGDPSDVSLLFTNVIDDGAIFYLNGTEIQRIGMPAGSVTYTTPSSRSLDNATTYDVFLLPSTALSNLVSGTNVLAVEVHQTSAASSDIVFGSSVSAIIGTGTKLTRGPYLQSGSHTNLIIRWRTDTANDGKVWYGTNLSALTQTAVSIVGTEHEVALNGLLPDTKYYYAVGSSSGVLVGSNNACFFLTPPEPGQAKPTRIWVIGDSGTGNGNQIAVRDAYESFTGSRHTDLWLMLGDNAYGSGFDDEYQAKVFNIYTNLLRTSVLWPTLGNHDTDEDGAYHNSYPYFNIFSLPRNGDCSGLGSGTEHYYSFDYGNIHFICLDSMTADRATNGAMACWLRLDLAETTNAWIIAYWHHPPYSKGTHDSDLDAESVQMRQNFLPILEAGGVDLVLSGHSHVYERSFLLDGHYGLSGTLTASMKLDPGDGRTNGTGAYRKPAGAAISHQGTIYAVVGTSGQTNSTTSGFNHPAMYIGLDKLGSLVLDISDNRLDATFLRESGAVNDSFTLLKQNFAPIASNVVFSVPADQSANLLLSGSDLNRDPLSYTTNSWPTHGWLSGFNPTNGSFTYLPAHGYFGGDSFSFRASDGHTNSPLATVALNILPPADTNSNGLPDYWESLFQPGESNDDPDQDGLNNWQEYLANTNPTNAASVLQFTSIIVGTNGNITLTWAAVGGTRYRIAYSDGNPQGELRGPFVPIVRSVAEEMNPAPAGASATQSFNDDFSLSGGPPPNPARYYVLQVVR